MSGNCNSSCVLPVPHVPVQGPTGRSLSCSSVERLPVLGLGNMILFLKGKRQFQPQTLGSSVPILPGCQRSQWNQPTAFHPPRDTR